MRGIHEFPSRIKCSPGIVHKYNCAHLLHFIIKMLSDQLLARSNAFILMWTGSILGQHSIHHDCNFLKCDFANCHRSSTIGVLTNVMGKHLKWQHWLAWHHEVRCRQPYSYWIPPNAVPFHVRPVTSWKGRVEISWPAAATPIMTLVPQPL